MSSPGSNYSVLSPNHPEALYYAIQQVMFLPESRTIWIKDPDSDWQKFELGMFFGK
ncbi:MAG TPA: hypothetical protein PLM96_03530 [Methanoregulaceae archaeon]|jgi:hypothetical protein|nr:hypothetical protein [Methanolinea sp.]MDD5050046.1 hypothetical protein [Methanoregulaceae archaeon]MDD5686096.1 hypothetical protein [Methanoregulaceae archaeon]HOP66966.1 hypothetical protein [Methanoregulaceae archaeon]HPJ74200.1 hypothetical protein [Methanoregulaceae archaeon]